MNLPSASLPACWARSSASRVALSSSASLVSCCLTFVCVASTWDSTSLILFSDAALLLATSSPTYFLDAHAVSPKDPKRSAPTVNSELTRLPLTICTSLNKWLRAAGCGPPVSPACPDDPGTGFGHGHKYDSIFYIALS